MERLNEVGLADFRLGCSIAYYGAFIQACGLFSHRCTAGAKL